MPELHEIFYTHIKENKIPIISLANYLLVSRWHLYEVLNGNRTFTDAMRIKLNLYLNTTFGEPDTEERTDHAT